MATADGCIPANSSYNTTFLWLLSSRSDVTPFSSSDESTDRISRAVLVVVENVIYVGIFPVLVTGGVITNVINMVIFARQGLSDRINMCLFR